jgi:hypothetical protein
VRRLIEDELRPGSPEHALADLVRAVPPLANKPFVADRIFARVKCAATPRRRRPAWIAGVVALGLGISVAAAAQVGHLYLANHPSPPSPLATATSAPATRATTAAPAGVTDVGNVVAEGSPSEPTDPASTQATKSAAPTSAQATPSTRVRLGARAGEASRFAGGEDPAPLLEAIRTLRSNGDPARAGVLLAQYLKAYPHSLLSEDALALSIEAAVARHDSRSVADLARRYLAQFPAGRYVTFVSRATQPSAP